MLLLLMLLLVSQSVIVNAHVDCLHENESTVPHRVGNGLAILLSRRDYYLACCRCHAHATSCISLKVSPSLSTHMLIVSENESTAAPCGLDVASGLDVATGDSSILAM